MKHIEVVAAIIKKENTILVTQRGYGDFKGLWEFPGGKIEPGETKETALKREIKEELNVDIDIKDFFQTVEYDYTTFHLSLHCFFAEISKGIIMLTEHENAKWLTAEELDAVPWLEADIEIIKNLKRKL